MNHAPVPVLLGAVRRRLWRGQFVAAGRLALWATSALGLTAVALHLVVGAVPAAAVGGTLALLWSAAMAHAAWRRPSQAAAALWADRHLGGASAYTTLLEGGAAAQAQEGAWHRLEQWAAAQASAATLRLAARRESLHLWRPLAATLVCTALAAVVLTLPEPAAAPPLPAAANDAAASDRPAALTEAQAASAWVSEVASALRSAPAETQPEPRGAGGAAKSGAGQADESRSPEAAEPGASAHATGPQSATAAAARPADAPPGMGAGQSTGPSAGREAGGSRDERADAGASRALGGSLTVQRSAMPERTSPHSQQADLGSPAAFAEGPATASGPAAQPLPAAAAATPPTAAEATRLSAGLSNYVQAWLKATAPGR
jgi:hypothetical protein